MVLTWKVPLELRGKTLKFTFNVKLKGNNKYKNVTSITIPDKTIDMMAALGNPERKFKSIHVAGTNGKGSVSHFIASILQEAGLKVGLYTSPHLVDFR